MYKVDIVNNGGWLFKIKSKNYEFDIDIKGSGITPPDTLLASLGSCIGVYIRKYLEGAKIVSREFRISVEADFSQDHPICFREIQVNIDLQDTQIDTRRKQALLEFVKNCPVHNTLEAKPAVSFKIT
jgi:uncharacterized OsmC-like protein